MEKSLPWNKRLKYERLRRGWSQGKLAEKIGSNTKTIIRWERGLHLPTPELQQELAIAFETSIEDLGLLETAQAAAISSDAGQVQVTPGHENWGEASRIQQLYGREHELALLEDWINVQQCRVIALLGIGGVGKSTLAIELATRVKSTFDFLFWRSLKNAPPLKALLEECIEFLTRHQPDLTLPTSAQAHTEETLLVSLLHLLQHKRCLLILDNFESVIQQHTFTGQYRQGYAGYGELLRRVSEAEQRSCLVLTSRERPAEILNNRFVCTLNLVGLNEEAGKALLEMEHLLGQDADKKDLVQRLSGNPLALKLIAESIRELFHNKITAFLTEGEAIFGGVQKLLDQQFERLSILEQQLLYNLAIEREAITPQDLQHDLAHFVSRGKIIEALESLHRRSLIETGSWAGSFTIQPVIMEYITGRLIERVCDELMQEEFEDGMTSSLRGLPWHLASLPLAKAETKDYLRKTQLLLLLEPIVVRLRATYGEQSLLLRLRAWLDWLRREYPQHPGYLASNILNLLITMQANLRGFDFSHLWMRQVDLRGVALPEVNFAFADLAHSIFNDTFSTIFCIALSSDGSLLAAGTSSGEIRLWHSQNTVPLLTCRGHSDWIRSIAFSSDNRLLASGSEDRVLRVWEVNSGRCLMALDGHNGPLRSVAFSPDNRTIASGSEDGTLRLWDSEQKTCLRTLHGHASWVRAVAFSPDGRLLVSGSDDRTVRVWDSQTGLCINVLHGHQARIRSVAFSAESTLLASAGDDMVVHIWNIESGEIIRTLRGHGNQVRCIRFSWDGSLIASGCEDSTARIWSAQSGELLFTLHGHANRVSSLTFMRDNQMLITAGEDQTIRFWEVQTGRCARTLHGHTTLIKSLAFSPDGLLLAEGSDDRMIRIWDISTRTCYRQMQGHTHRIRTVAFSPDGNLLASGSEDYTVRIWQSSSGQCLHVLQGHTHLIRSVAFNQDGTLLVSASYDHTVRIWDTQDGRCRAILQGHTEEVWNAVFSPEKQLVISSGKDLTIRVWDSENGTCVEVLPAARQRVRAIYLHKETDILITGGSDDHRICLWNARKEQETWLSGHRGWIRALDFRRDGKLIASGGQDQTLRLWNGESGQCLRVLQAQGEVSSVAFSPDGTIVAGGSNAGSIYLWNVQTGEQLSVLKSEQLYEGLNILGVHGLSETQHEALLALGAVEDNQQYG